MHEKARLGAFFAVSVLFTTACHTPGQADGNYYAGAGELGRHGGAVWVAQRMGVPGGSERPQPPAPPKAVSVPDDAGTRGDAAP